MSVNVKRRDALTIITIDRPEARNALAPETMAGLGRAFQEVEENPEVRAAILTGAGDRAFCAGMDLKAFAAGGKPTGDGPGLEIITYLVFPKPILAASNRSAAGRAFSPSLALTR